MLLTFSVANFRCFTDEAVLDLVRPSLKTLTPKPGSSWIQETQRVAAIYGANASGKSTLLDALETLHRAISGERGILYQPDRFRPDVTEPTTYRLEFTADDRRFSYTVKAEPWGISSEELWEVGARWKKVFSRGQASADAPLDVSTSSSLRGPNREVKKLTGVDDLFLGVAFRYRHESLFLLPKHCVPHPSSITRMMRGSRGSAGSQPVLPRILKAGEISVPLSPRWRIWVFSASSSRSRRSLRRCWRRFDLSLSAFKAKRLSFQTR